MRITIKIPDGTYRALKAQAKREGVPIGQIVLRGIQRELGRAGAPPVRKFQLPLIRSSRPGTLNLTNDQIDELTAFC